VIHLNRLIIILLVFLTAGCSGFFRKKTERTLARVQDDYLYESDLQGVIPGGTAPKDSSVLAKNFINSWVRQRLIIHQAEKNLTSEQMDFTHQLENYRNSLVIYEYENALVKQKLDTIILEDEIETYYDANHQNFLLKDNIVQFQYVKLPLRSPKISQFKKLLRSDESVDKTRLAEQCEQFAADYFLDDQNWLLFNDVLKQIPIRTYNQEEFLQNHREVEYQDSMFVYLVRFRDFKIKEGVSPLSFEKERIRNIILNKRKIDLITKMHDDLYEKAVKNNDFEVY
jgi:hypothetical protein